MVPPGGAPGQRPGSRPGWRVTYSAYGALATDQYPPFTLAEVPEYPAHLEVKYPERLSRGRALVKWWLLAIPHYLVVGLLLVAVLAIVAGVVVLATGAYPRGLYDLLLGLDRWVIRVAAYAGLMTDVYPPFRLDMGEHDGGTLRTGPAPAGPAPSGPGPSDPGPSGPAPWAAGPAGYPQPPGYGTPRGGYGTPTGRYGTPPRASWTNGRVLAVVPGELEVHDDGGAYLDGARHHVATGPGNLRLHDGSAPVVPPADVDIWLAEATGPGSQEIRTDLVDGTWVVVVMAADGSAGVDAAVDVGATGPWARGATTLLLAAGLAGTVAGAAVIVGASRRAVRG